MLGLRESNGHASVTNNSIGKHFGTNKTEHNFLRSYSADFAVQSIKRSEKERLGVVKITFGSTTSI